MRPYLEAKACSTASTASIPAAAWRGLQMAVALLHTLRRPTAATAAAAAAAPSLPTEAAEQLATAEVALLQHHLARVLACATAELLESGPPLRTLQDRPPLPN